MGERLPRRLSKIRIGFELVRAYDRSNIYGGYEEYWEIGLYMNEGNPVLSAPARPVLFLIDVIALVALGRNLLLRN